ncbi:NB-ARC and TPR domain protein [Xylaria sp. FL1777]|nr:NB-ARC and TPR domain protein [Xylaria sp. FL1777]
MHYLSTVENNPHNIQSAEDIIEFTKTHKEEEYPSRDIGKFLWTQAEGVDVESEKYHEMVEQERFFGGEGGILGAMDKYNLDVLAIPSSFGIGNDLAAKMGFPVIGVPLGFYPENTTIQLEDILEPGLAKLKVFTDTWIFKTSSKINPSVLWGLIRLTIKILREEKPAVSRVCRMMSDFFHKMSLLNSCFSRAETFSVELQESCIESGIALLNFLTYVINFMRNDLPSYNDEWKPLEEKYSSVAKQVDQLLSRSKKPGQTNSHTAEQGHGKRASQTTTSNFFKATSPAPFLEEKAKLPCIILPSIRTSRFFDRVDVIEKMDQYFSKIDTSTTFSSLAIHGLGGVGKSTIALRYAEQKLRQDDLDALFWVHSEKLVSIRQSFTDIAMRLRLEDARQGDHNKNHALVLNWLQHTQCRWLIVYDNAEDPDLVRDFWPLSSRGQAIITCRNPVFGFELADRGMEIANWDNDTGLRFLLHLLSADISMELEKDETTSALQLSEKLSGHALAISTMAGLIHRRALSILEFLNFYNQHPSEVHGISGNRSINALWEISYKSLDTKSQCILAVMSFLEPDSIPQALFEPMCSTDLPESLSFCANSLLFSEAIEDLLTLALIKRDKSSRTFSLHRLVQTSFKHFMGFEKRQIAFNDATVLVSKAFPRRDSNVAQLYLMWDRCALYLQHVISLKDCFREEHGYNPQFSVLQTYCDLNNACQRYLLELNSYDELADLLEVNRLAMNTLPKLEQTVGLQGSLTSHQGQLLVHLGKAEEGVKWLKESYNVRRGDVPFNPRESSWAADNIATGLATLNRFAEAMQWQELARNHFQEWSNLQTDRKGEWPAEIMNSMGLGLVWSGKAKQARELMDGALLQVESVEPYNWAVAAYTHFGLGTVSRHEGNHELAEYHFLEAQNLWLKGGQMRSDPFNAACMYRLGCTALGRGYLEAAIKHLRDALVVTNMQKNTLLAEHARCLFKLSEALEQEPRFETEARAKREEAGRLLRKREPTARDSSKASTYDDLICILWR